MHYAVLHSDFNFPATAFNGDSSSIIHPPLNTLFQLISRIITPTYNNMGKKKGKLS